MSNFSTKNFFGNIEGRNIYSFLGELDYDLETSTERIEHLKNILTDERGNVHSFFERLFEQTYDNKTKLNTSYIKLVLNTTDGLYTDTNVAEVITRLTDYILFTEDMRAQDKENKTQYKIYKDEALFKRMQREISLEAEMEKISDGDGEKDIDSLIHILTKEQNFRKNTGQVIFAKDLDDEECGEVLKAYQCSINNMNERLTYNKKRIPLLDAILVSKEDMTDIGYKMMLEMSGVNSKTEAHEIKIQLVRENKSLIKHIGLMKCDMLDSKEMIKRPIRFKHLMNGSTEVDLSRIEFIPKQKGDVVPWLREKAMELEEYYSGILDGLEQRKSKGELVLVKIQKYNKLYIETQFIQSMSDEDLYEEKYLAGIKDVIKQLITQPDKEYYDFQNELELEVYLAKEILASIKMDELDRLIISFLRQGLTQKDTSFLLNKDFKNIVGEDGISQKSISKRLDEIINRIMDFSESELDNYLDGFRPVDKVKSCSKCGRTLNKDKFDKNKDGQFGLRSQCKECRGKK